MRNDLFHKELVGTDYVKHLRKDLNNCELLKFLMAFVSGKGIDIIGRELLTRSLQKKGSFGITNLACNFSYNDIMKLQEDVGGNPKLKLFLNLAKVPEGEESIALLHSKVAYLKICGHRLTDHKHVVYIGSHNWTNRALGSKKNGVNAEVSVRFEFGGDEINSTLLQGVLSHLNAAWELPACLPAIAENELTFSQWHQLMCPAKERPKNGNSFDEVIVLIAVCKEDYFGNRDLTKIVRSPIYFRCDSEEEGRLIEAVNQTILILTWRDEKSLSQKELPLILFARASSIIETDKGHGSNSSKDAIAGFQWAISDIGKNTQEQQQIHVKGIGNCSYWSIEQLLRESTSKEFDNGKRPSYQFLLEVNDIISPESLMNLGLSSLDDLFYKNGEIAFLKDKNIPFERLDGIEVGSHKLVNEIRRVYRDVFQMKKTKVKVVRENENPAYNLKVSSETINRLVVSKDGSIDYQDLRSIGLKSAPKIVAESRQSMSLFEPELLQLKRINSYFLERGNSLVLSLSKRNEV